ncbi:MAG: four helix bundle protein [Saprospiraceae bacterium]|nr:four helix bundle protein [Saprospiraceae bacterium]
MRNFRELHIWELAIGFSVQVYSATDKFPKREQYGLVSQMNRASVSIASNIAEGCRGSDKELVHYLNLALGSSFELETQLIIAQRLEYIEQKQFNSLIEQLNILQKRINAFRSSIK